jgi:hypothetical protein
MNPVFLSIFVAISIFCMRAKESMLRKKKSVEHFMPPLSFKLDRQPTTQMEYSNQRDLVRQPPPLNITPVQTASNYQAYVQQAQQMPSFKTSDSFVSAGMMANTQGSQPMRAQTTPLYMNYSVPSTNQSGSITPRMGNVSYGANINYRPPQEKFLAVEPNNPLGYSADGEIQPIIHDRYIYATKKSRLSFAGDPIRGDLPIMPMQGNWFAPAVTPHIDLREGALSVIGGRHNDTSNELGEMKYTMTNGAWNINAGVPFKMDNTLVKETSGVIPLYREIVNNAGDVTVATMY